MESDLSRLREEMQQIRVAPESKADRVKIKSKRPRKSKSLKIGGLEDVGWGDASEVDGAPNDPTIGFTKGELLWTPLDSI